MISVVIPAYNEEEFIGACLESLKQQDYTGDYEVIVVDNGSQDQTPKIALNAGARIVNCPQKGVCYARQAGAESARGEIVVQADADTIYPRWWLRRIQRQFNSHPKAIAVAGSFIYVNPPWWAGFEYFLRVFFGFLSNIVFGRPLIISGANFSFYKKALMQIGGYRQEAYSADQLDISRRLRKVGKIFYDIRSYGATSSRSVAKPTLVVMREFIQNLKKFSQNTISNIRGNRKKRSKKVNSGSPGTYIKIAIPILILAFLAYGYYIPASPVFGKVYSKATGHAKVIALTFDDGPNEPYTSQILDILKMNNINATFFVIGKNVETYPDVTRRILAEGNVIGNHTYSHNANHALSFTAYKDVRLAEQSIDKVTGVDPHLYRPPHGKKSPWEVEAIKNDGLCLVLWSISTPELVGNPPDIIASQITKKAKPGGIILLHDGFGTLHSGGRANKEITVMALPIIIGSLKSEGYEFVTIPELLGVPAYK